MEENVGVIHGMQKLESLNFLCSREKDECIPGIGHAKMNLSFLFVLGSWSIRWCLPTLKVNLPHVVHSDSHTNFLWKCPNGHYQNNALPSL
jgi:hypothetical protein